MGLALYHRLVPLLYVHLRDHVAEAPARVISALHDEARRRSVHVLFLASEMARVAKRLGAEDVPYLVLKGPSLASAYGNVAKRPFVDNDLLIQRHDFSRVASVLSDLGFATHKRSDRQQAAHLWIYGQSTFERMVGGARSAIDLHTDLLPVGFSYAPPFADMSQRARTLTLVGEGVSALGWGDLFLTLCANALKDQWTRLRLATDIAEVALYVDDWDAVDAQAGRFGSRRALHLAVLVATDEVGGEFPPALLRQSREDHRARWLADQARAFLAASADERIQSGRRRVALNLLVQDGLRGQLRYSGYVALRRATERWANSRT